MSKGLDSKKNEKKKPAKTIKEKKAGKEGKESRALTMGRASAQSAAQAQGVGPQSDACRLISDWRRFTYSKNCSAGRAFENSQP